MIFLRKAVCILLVVVLLTPPLAAVTSSSLYNPPWTQQLAWTDNNLFHRYPGSIAWLEDAYTPWWQNRVAHPVADYSASLLPVGKLRLDGALDFELTTHRTLPGWDVAPSPSGINNVYAAGSTSRPERTTRAGQSAYLNFGFHPIAPLSMDIGVEAIGNYDQRYWFPVNDEHRLYNDDEHLRIVRGEVRYETENVMLRGFQGTPNGNWVAQNDLFQLLPAQRDVEHYRRMAGTIEPRGGEFRAKTSIGSLQVIGGSEIRFRYGPSVYAKYDLPIFGTWENSFVFRRENIPFSFDDKDETRWASSYNASFSPTERITAHAGAIYQPFRAGREYTDVSSNAGNSGVLGSEFEVRRRRALHRDGLGVLGRIEIVPTGIVDQVGAGYMYLQPLAGNKQQVELDVSRLVTSWLNISLAYQYRTPVRGPVPLLYEGTPSNPGALITTPRGPDDPFWVHWDNRKAHIGLLTFVFDPTPGTPFFRYQKDLLEEWNLGTEEESTWTGALQYRVAHYPTNMDRLYYWEEDGTLRFDPIFSSGGLSSARPLHSVTALVRWFANKWSVVGDVSAGEVLAGSGRAYTPATNFFKPSTLYTSAGLSARHGALYSFIRYGHNVWGPEDYHSSFGWAYAHLYQAGVSFDFLRDFQAGVRYIGARMTDQFLGSDTGAFNEYRFYLTYHFSGMRDVGTSVAQLGRPLPPRLPEASLRTSETMFTPDGSGPITQISLYPNASADAGILLWQVSIRDSQGLPVREWKGRDVPPSSILWDGRNEARALLPAGIYSCLLDVSDANGNEVTSPAQTIELGAKATAPVEQPAPNKVRPFEMTETPEGLKLTLSSFVLFEVNKYDLKATALNVLDQVIELLKTYPDNNLRISGYTDSVGSDDYNQVLSDRRARAVANYLTTSGINKSRISVVGYGKHRAVADNATEQGRQQNRRVEIDIIKK